MSLKNKIAAALASAAMMFAVAATPVGFAGFGVQSADASCSQIWLNEYANLTGKNANAGCSDRSNLKDFTAGIAPGQACNGQFFLSYGTWNDCTTSVSWIFGGNTQACLNNDSSYGGSVLKLSAGTSGWGNLGGSWDNQTSSIDVAEVDCFPSGNN
jgi:hypothetical protein